jgi:hypothetical protein
MKLDSCFHRKPWIPACTGMTCKRTRMFEVDFKSTLCLRPPRLRGEGGLVLLAIVLSVVGVTSLYAEEVQEEYQKKVYWTSLP